MDTLQHIDLTRRSLNGSLIALAAAPIPLFAQEPYPNKPIQLKVPFTPGGAADGAARIIATALGARLGQAIVIENKPGAAGGIAAEFVARAKPDGYTLLLVYSGIMTINPFVFEKVPFDAFRDFSYVGNIGDFPNVIVVNPSIPARNLRELVALARASATGLDTGVAGLGTTDQILAMQIAQKTGAKFKIIPYKGGGPVMTDLVGGQIQLATSSVSSVIPMVKAGRVRALAVSTSERWPSLPDVPTIAESGVAGVEMTTSMGIAGPAGMSRAVIDRLNSELNFVLGTREVSESLLNAGLRAQAGTPESYYDALKRSHDQYGPLIKSMGIKVE